MHPYSMGAEVPKVAVGRVDVLVAEASTPDHVANIDQATDQVGYAIWTDLEVTQHRAHICCASLLTEWLHSPARKSSLAFALAQVEGSTAMAATPHATHR